MAKTLPYATQSIELDDIDAVVRTLKSRWLTTGPVVQEFESRVASFLKADFSVAVSNGTAALHSIMAALDLQEGDEVIVPTLTFVSTANAVVFVGGTPVFADVNGDTLLIDPDDVQKKVGPRTRAVVAMDYGGQPADYAELRKICEVHELVLIGDSCHAFGADYRDEKIGTVADLTAFSFHPTKPITTGEGGLVATNRRTYANFVQRFRNHGITSTHQEREKQGQTSYEMNELGYNYRITDIQCALGISQLTKTEAWIRRRQEIANVYSQEFLDTDGIEPLSSKIDRSHAYHLYVIKLTSDRLSANRDNIIRQLRESGVGANVHYPPVHLQPFYVRLLGGGQGRCPIAESEVKRIISIPMYSSLSQSDQAKVIQQIKKIVARYC